MDWVSSPLPAYETLSFSGEYEQLSILSCVNENTHDHTHVDRHYDCEELDHSLGSEPPVCTIDCPNNQHHDSIVLNSNSVLEGGI